MYLLLSYSLVVATTIYMYAVYNVEEKNTHADLPWEASGAFLVTTLYTYSTQPAHLTCI